MARFTLQEIAAHIGAEVHGNGDEVITAVATLQGANAGDISFLANPKYRAYLSTTLATAVIIKPEELPHCPCNALVMDNSYVGFAHVAQMLDTTPDSASDIATSATIAEDAHLGDNVAIGANAVIEAGARIGDNTQIGPGCFVGRKAQIGANCKLWANVTVYHDCIIGADCMIQAGTVVGSDGFGYANDKGKWIKIPQLGKVVIGNSVELGANTTIDRGALEDTIIHDDVIIDNLVQIAHNAEIGKGTAIAACTVIAGSTTIGQYCAIAGMVGVNGHIEITDGVTLTGFAMVTKGIKEPGVYSSGIPALPNMEWRKNMVAFRNIRKFEARLKKLEAKSQQED
ncbi:MAG: UDP-3-O-(3-hydroxymyristoyl)glucosamine N-acyltransferase [Aestuariibacter sp.]